MANSSMEHEAAQANGTAATPELPHEINVIVERLTVAPSSTVHLGLARKSLAGVLVLLCPNASGSLSVVLTTRALTMRSFPGETALPGGRMEAIDVDISATALREAREEIGLSLPQDDIQILLHLEPFLSKNLLSVVPTVAFTHHTAEKLLKTFKANPAEVGFMWAWPLRDFLGLRDAATSPDEDVTYAFQDVKWLLGKHSRLHHFHHKRMASPVTGLTADILLHTALIAYDVAKPGFARGAADQLSNMDMLQAVLDGKAGLDGDERSALRGRKVAEGSVAGHAAT